jgi:hypothetical protein
VIDRLADWRGAVYARRGFGLECDMARWEVWLFRALALSFVGAGCFHASAFFDGRVEPRMSATGHAVFVGVNALTAIGMWLRPRWFVIPFAVLVVQQLVSHGDWAIAAYRAGWFDWRSWMVLATMPPMLALLVRDARRRSAAAAALSARAS